MRASQLFATARVFVLGASLVAGAAACTVVSGVDEMELRKGASAQEPAAGSDGGPGDGGARSPFALDAAADQASPVTQSGPATCGAQGSWTACDPNPSLVTCAERCQQQGQTCVESCCAYDELGDFAAQAGMVYALLDLECSTKSVSSTSKGGACADPTLLTASGAAQVRCCCK